MKTAGVAIGIGVMALMISGAFGASAQQTTVGIAPGVAEQLIRREHQLFDSFKNHDVALFNSLITSESWRVGAAGGRKMQDYAQNLKAAKAERFTLSDVKVLPINKDGAVVTYTLDQIGSFQGSAFATPVYASTVWVNDKGTWRIVFHQETPFTRR